MLKRLLGLATIQLALALRVPGGSGADKNGDDSKLDKKNGDDPKYSNFTYVPTADEVIDKMFEIGKVNKKDVIFDLGCGDGRILFMAAKKFGARGVGIDLNPVRIQEAM